MVTLTRNETLTETEAEEDILARYLPAVLREDTFLANFLRIFDAQLRPLLEMLDSIDQYFDVRLTPAELLPWLATWVGEEFPETLSDAAKRKLIAEAALIHRARGTRNGLKRALEFVRGQEVLVTENTSGLRLDGDAKLGINTSLQAFEAGKIHIVICGPDEGQTEAVRAIAERLKPAHTEIVLNLTDQ
jgi:phage tail-like protein